MVEVSTYWLRPGRRPDDATNRLDHRARRRTLWLFSQGIRARYFPHLRKPGDAANCVMALGLLVMMDRGGFVHALDERPPAAIPSRASDA